MGLELVFEPTEQHSNTTLVKVKYKCYKSNSSMAQIQIQHLLKLNYFAWCRRKRRTSIQIQHLLKLNEKLAPLAIGITGFKYNTC